MHYLCYGQRKQTKHSAKPFLNLGFTQVHASVDGYIANLDLRLGSEAVANQPALALVDSASFWVHGYLRETMIARVAPGDRAVITLMTYPDRPLRGRVDSIGWGISQSDGGTGNDQLRVGRSGDGAWRSLRPCGFSWSQPSTGGQAPAVLARPTRAASAGLTERIDV
jgi:hypothetical protein